MTADPQAPDRKLGVTAPSGFRASGVAAGVKTAGTDLTLVVNDGPAHAAAGVFTRNKVPAAPVLWSRQVLRERRLRAVVLNSGNANACTGPEGFQHTHATAEKAAGLLDCGAIEIAVCSTGMIGEPLPIDALLAGVDAATAGLANGPDADLAAATAVMTTDTVPKQAALHHEDGWSIGGFAKGAGMCAPNMATMLSVLTTDAVLDPAELDAALRDATATTFGRLDIDGSSSTNDTVLLLCSGASGKTPAGQEFRAALLRVCADLVGQLRADAEGVTKHVGVRVRGAVSESQAVTVARAVARDSLVKTALFGSDPNWGRVAMAVGNAETDIRPEHLDITLNGVPVCVSGARAADRSEVDLTGREISIEIDLHAGAAEATVLTTDLSHAYVEENSAYSS